MAARGPVPPRSQPMYFFIVELSGTEDVTVLSTFIMLEKQEVSRGIYL
jgi:hypothetical protein